MEDLKSQFEATTAKLIEARRNLLAAREKAILSKENLKDTEAYLLPEIVGKNQADRDANMRTRTENQRRVLWADEIDERRAILELEILRDCRRQLENIALIESGEA